jgi:hypothetical protein
MEFYIMTRYAKCKPRVLIANFRPLFNSALRWWHPHARGRDTFYMRHACIEQKSLGDDARMCRARRGIPPEQPRNSFSAAADDLMLKTFVWFVIPNVCNLNLLVVGRSKVKSLKADVYVTDLDFLKAQELFQWKSRFPKLFVLKIK